MCEFTTDGEREQILVALFGDVSDLRWRYGLRNSVSDAESATDETRRKGIAAGI